MINLKFCLEYTRGETSNKIKMRITPKQYAQTLYEITDGKSRSEIEKSIADFARFLHKNRKDKLVNEIIGQFRKIYDQKKKIIEFEVITREKLDKALEEKIRHYLRGKYKAEEVILKNVIDESIKGGVMIKTGDEVIDGSVRRKLEELRKIIA